MLKSLMLLRRSLLSRLLACAVLAGAAGSSIAGAAAGDTELDITAIRSAQRMARATEAERTRFHAPYLLEGTPDTIEQLEVITEGRLLAGDWTFASDTRAAAAAVKPWNGQVAIRARFRFHPHNIYTSPPRISIVLVEGARAHEPLKLTADPQFGLGSVPPVLTGVVVEASFDAQAVGPRTVTIVLVGTGIPEVQRTVDLASLR
jgi:hypothetical protein